MPRDSLPFEVMGFHFVLQRVQVGDSSKAFIQGLQVLRIPTDPLATHPGHVGGLICASSAKGRWVDTLPSKQGPTSRDFPS